VTLIRSGLLVKRPVVRNSGPPCRRDTCSGDVLIQIGFELRDTGRFVPSCAARLSGASRLIGVMLMG